MSSIYGSYFAGGSWGPSCICTGQSLATPDGWIGVDDARRKFLAGRRVDLLVDGVPAPIVGAMVTSSRSREVTLSDGRSVRLTGSHALPSGEDTIAELHGDRYRVIAARFVAPRAPAEPRRALGRTGIDIVATPAGWRLLNGRGVPSGGRIIDDHRWISGEAHPEWDARFRAIAPGDEIDGSIVADVRDIGVCEAVRLVTSRMGWLSLRTAAGPIRVGQRWHEMDGVFFRQGGEYVFTPWIWNPGAEVLTQQGHSAREGQPLWCGMYGDHPEMVWSHLAAQRERRRTGVHIPEIGEYAVHRRLPRVAPAGTARGAAAAAA